MLDKNKNRKKRNFTVTSSSDDGGPFYSSSYNETQIPIYTVIEIGPYSPDLRNNKLCLGGHKISCIQIAAYSEWIVAIISN
ncbi:hypothetical protein PVAND_001629 [Polypedilum vanderplanki]|uniref:Uncharacterized protein n=1 Tax=Polypedilum vanderplanki TaxID=319348 RepID=A0A9J6BNH8_POLVA|nr:hypothetical protein PVAND_001629 [Polypedilum vanderplanki]